MFSSVGLFIYGLYGYYSGIMKHNLVADFGPLNKITKEQVYGVVYNDLSITESLYDFYTTKFYDYSSLNNLTFRKMIKNIDWNNENLDKEIDGLRALGVQFHTDTIIGKTISVDELQQQGFKGVFVGSGAGLPRFMNIPGENLNGVLSCNEYLTRVNLMDASNPKTDTPLLYGRNVAVIGGGNTAMDAVRTAKRLGAERAIIVYRRSEEEMPARVEEVRHAKEEGIEFMTLHNPIEYHADETGRVKEALLQVMALGEPDESGRRSPIAVEGQVVTLPIDLVIVSVGVSPNPLIPSSVDGLEVSKRGTIVVNDQMQSSIPTLFAGGDIVRGGATVILAMADGRKAAKEMHEYLSK